MTLSYKLPSKDPRYVAVGSSKIIWYTAPGVEAVGHLASWEFNNGGPGADTTEAIRVGMWNRAPGASNESGVDAILYGSPVIHADDWRFPMNVGFRTQISDVTDLTVYTLARSLDTGIGATAADRAHIVGSFGAPADHGFEFNFLNMSGYRSTAYDSTALKTQTLTIPLDTPNKWRILRQRLQSSGVGARNCTGDSVDNEPTPTAFTGGRVVGGQKIGVGQQFIGTDMGNYTKHKDIAAIHIFNAIHTLAQENAILAQMRARIPSSITEGSA